MRTSLTITALSALALGVGCASVPVPAEQLSNSRASIRAAEVAGAEQVPPASLHLDFAREQVTRATQLISVGENKRAALMLDRAEADAELAMSLAQEEPLRQDARRTLDTVRALQAGQQQQSP